MAPRGCLGYKRSRDENSHVTNFRGFTVNWIMLVAFYSQCNHMDRIWWDRRRDFWRQAHFMNVSQDYRHMLYEGSVSLQLRTLVLMSGMRRRLALVLARDPTQKYGRFDFFVYILQLKRFSKKRLPTLRVSRPVDRVPFPKEGVVVVASSLCRSLYAVGLRNGTVCVVDGSSRKITMPNKHDKGVRSLWFGESILVSGGDDGTIMVFFLGGGLSYAFLMARYVGHAASVWSVCVHKDIILSGSDDRRMAIWKLSSGNCVSICENSDSVLAVTVSKDGNTAFSAGSDHQITMWDITDPVKPCKLRKCEEHTGKVTKLQLLGEDSLVSFGWDGQIIMWEHNNKRLVKVSKFKVAKNRGWVCCVDLDSIVAAGNDGKVYLVTPVSRTECDVQVVHEGKYEITSGALIHNRMMIVTSDNRCLLIELDEHAKRHIIESTP